MEVFPTEGYPTTQNLMMISCSIYKYKFTILRRTYMKINLLIGLLLNDDGIVINVQGKGLFC